MAEPVAPETRPRGRPDPARSFRWFLVAAGLLHLPLTPLGPLLGLLMLLRPPSHEPPEEHLNAIPVSLLSDEELAQLGGPAPEPPPPAPAPRPEAAEAPAEPEAELPKPEPRPKPRPKPVVAADAGTSVDGGDGGKPAEVASAAPSAEAPVTSAAPAPVASSAVAAGDAGAPGTAGHEASPKGGDPLALVGRSASVADPNANVKLLLFNDRIRTLPVGPRIGALVARLPQWRSFFGPTGLDPVRDIDRMYVAGPRFRVSDEVVAILEYAVPQAEMRKAIDAIVRREPRGEWLNTKVPAARARADRAERVFVLPKQRLLLMVPPHLAEDAVDKAPGLSVPSVGGGAAVVAFIANPWRALLGVPLPVELPRTIASASITVLPAADGGATIRIEAVDASPEAAQSDAAVLTTAVNALTQRNMGALGALLFGGSTLSLIEPMKLVPAGKKIQGEARVTPRQLDRLLGFAEGWVDAIEGRPVRAPRPATAPSGAEPARAPAPRPAPAASAP